MLRKFRKSVARYRRRLVHLRRPVELYGEALILPGMRRGMVQRSRRVLRKSSPMAATRLPCLYVDVSVIARDDAGTGIQRVVRGVMRHLPRAGAEEWNVVFVAADGAQPYSPIDLSGGADAIAPPIAAEPGDVFLGLDYSLHAIAFHQKQLEQFRADGGQLWFLVHDLLPVQRPDWFSRQTKYRFAKWLRLIAGLADGFFCNSDQTELDLRQALKQRFNLEGGFATVVLPMGSDIKSARLADLSGRGTGLPTELEDRPYVLMVGTLEPRKGHDLVIAALEELWKRRADVTLVLVGRRGWKTDRLEERIAIHPELGSRLFRYDDISDEQLEQFYCGCEGVVIAALAEGYGLPLIEALHYGKPVLARDLHVFREHQECGVRFFPDTNDVRPVATAIDSWLEDVRADRLIVRAPTTTWEDTAKSLVHALQRQR